MKSPCVTCGMSIPEGADSCINCARPKKKRIDMIFKPPVKKKTRKKTS